jgi:hypothetical protein
MSIHQVSWKKWNFFFGGVLKIKFLPEQIFSFFRNAHEIVVGKNMLGKVASIYTNKIGGGL